MLDINKPMRAVHINGTSQPSPVEYLCSYNGLHIISHDLSHNRTPNLWQCDATGHMGGRAWRIENVPPVPITHRRLAVLYVYKGGPPVGALFCNEFGLREFKKNNPVVIVATKFIDITEGDCDTF